MLVTEPIVPSNDPVVAGAIDADGDAVQQHEVAVVLPRIPKLWWITSALFAITVIAAVIVSLLPSGYLVDSPGEALGTSQLVTVPKTVRTYTHDGGFRLVTVSETAKPVFGQALVGWLDPDSDVFPRTDVVGNTPHADEQRYELVLMQNAKSSAVYQAMVKLGMGASRRGGGVFVDRIVEHSPADGKLVIGDTITSINGSSVSTVDDIARFMEDAKVGQKVALTVDRLGETQDKRVSITLGSTKRDKKTVPLLGIYMETHPIYTFPFEVGFDTGDIGGPSAGLSLTLSLIDKLSSENLTGGRDVAVTGTMEADGSVGPIGGIRQKVAAVRAAGVKYFLVPIDNVADAKKVAGKSVKIIPVKTLTDALAKLRALPRGKTN